MNKKADEVPEPMRILLLRKNECKEFINFLNKNFATYIKSGMRDPGHSLNFVRFLALPEAWYASRATLMFVFFNRARMKSDLLNSKCRNLSLSGSRYWRQMGFVTALAFLMNHFGPIPYVHSEETPNPGFSGELAASEAQALLALHEVLEDHIIHGTRVFEREPTLTGAEEVPSTPLFSAWQGGGKVFYKVRNEVVAPRHFKESTDQGTIAVRYVVVSVTEARTRIHIEAIFVESGHRAVHPSDGTVESSEFKAIQEHLQAIQFAAQEAADIKRRRDSADLVKQTTLRRREDETTMLASAQSSVKDLEERLKNLRHEVERRVKAPGADLKAAPFQSAAKVVTVPAYTEVVVVIVTPHWYGVETPEGQRGWMPIDQLESLP